MERFPCFNKGVWMFMNIAFRGLGDGRRDDEGRGQREKERGKEGEAGRSTE